ncbi:PREDICTED: protein NRT1/ PTR FAMILY 2.8-like [Tarenaya hassleriana]|uniref:protein NRT1/ PTR FAMILY 2.8-like n=1 Tax=Tarenaya hassleriana TaxID=28532 RepID=UPI00053CA1D7|nr:PREDICTED: protein NRT1/ PTR FAMILY 2.8-like [Tarenaya hassleriana]
MEDGLRSSSAAASGDRTISSPPEKPAGGWRTIKYIIGNETFEKLAYMSLIANMTVYLKTNYNLGGVVLLNIVGVWSGSSNVTAILGALVADTFLGRFHTLLFGSFLSLIGMTLMTLTAGLPNLRPPACSSPPECSQPDMWQFTFLGIALTFTALGAGGIRACNIAFGADQFDTNTEKGRSQLESFFNWWYFSFTIALVFALTVVVYVQTNVSWTLGFAIPTACFAVGIVTYLFGYRAYVLVKPQGSVFLDIPKVLVAVLRKRELDRSKPSTFYDPSVTGTIVKLPYTDRLTFFDRAALITSPDELDDQGVAKNNWKLCSVQQVESFKMLVGMFPVWFSGILFIMSMDQQNNIGILQAIQTNNNVVGTFRVPPAWMGLSSMIALSIWIVLYERLWVPQSKKFTGKSKRLKMKNRFVVGIVFSIICPLVAAAVEIHRRELAIRSGGSFQSPMTILWLLPQFALSGFIEAFGAVALMEFLTTELPESMRTVSGAIFFLSLSMASYANSVLVNIVHESTDGKGSVAWLGSQDLNRNRLENFYYLSAAIGAANLLYFCLFARRFVTRNGGGNSPV